MATIPGSGIIEAVWQSEGESCFGRMITVNRELDLVSKNLTCFVVRPGYAGREDRGQLL